MQTGPILLGNTPPARRRFAILPVLLLALVLLTLLVTGDVRASSGWELTVYYTPVESYHGGTPTKVYGCPTINCDSASATKYLGTFPSDFLDKVQQEGAGKITDGQDASTPYLNWTYDGDGYYWLDTAARSASGAPLVPWQTSAAASKYPFGTKWKVTGCGVNSGDYTAVDPTMCQKVKASTWVVQDRFEAGNSTYHHADLYVGLEDRPDYEDTAPQYFDWVGSATTLTTLSSTPKVGSSNPPHSAPPVTTPGTPSQPSNAPGSEATNPSAQPDLQQSPPSETPYTRLQSFLPSLSDNQPQSPSGTPDNQSQSPSQTPDSQTQSSPDNSGGGDQQAPPSSSAPAPQGSADQQQAPSPSGGPAG